MSVKKKGLRLAIIFILIGVAIFLSYHYRAQLNLGSLRENINHFGIYAPLAFMGLYIVAVVFFLPGSILTLGGGLLFGPVWGTLYNISAAIIGSTIAFYIARLTGQEWIREKSGDKLQVLMDGVDREGWKFVAVVRLIPIIPFNLLNYALGLTKIKPLAYILASAIFMLPATFAYTYLGSLGETAISGKQGLLKEIAIAISLLVIVACLPWIVKRFRGNNS